MHRGIYDYFRLTFLGLLSKSTVSVHRVSGDLAEAFSGPAEITTESFSNEIICGVVVLVQVRVLCVKDDVLLQRTEEKQTPYPLGEQRNEN